MKHTYVCIHILQDVPPANLNRDDNGTPKQADYGGVPRLRVSSQAWKRCSRKHFGTAMEPAELGVRTRRLHGLLTDLLVQRGMDQPAASEAATAALASIKITPDKRKPEYSSYLLFAGRRQLEQLADAIAQDGADPKTVPTAEILGSMHSLDVALFGRMVADMTALNVDAAAQVAHALSTHAAPSQFDYFTAVDDEQEKDEAGAGMIGTVEFSSGTLYRYATVGLEQLVDNMGDREAAIDGIGQFIRSFVMSMPTGKQNTFAAHTRPALVLVELRDQPVSYMSAFEAPVRATPSSGFMAASQAALVNHCTTEQARWGDVPALAVASYASPTEASLAHRLESAFGPSVTMDEVVNAVTARLAAGAQDD